MIGRSVRRFSSLAGVTYDKSKDAYKLLGVSPTEEDKKIKLAYYKLA